MTSPELNLLRREGDVWLVVSGMDGRGVRVRDSTGVRLLARLIEHPGHEHHVLDLSPDATRDANAMTAGGLDEAAKAAYRQRVVELREEITEAEDFNDSARAEHLREELAVLTREISRAVGLGGHDRRTGTAAERARVRVTRALRTVLSRLRAELPALGAHLEHALRTGTYCVYAPDPSASPRWNVEADPSVDPVRPAADPGLASHRDGVPGPEADAAKSTLPTRLEAFAARGFVGRDHELTLLTRRWKDAVGGTAHLVLVSGEPGVAKTGLAGAFARQVAVDGGRVVYGSCDDAFPLPYRPWMQVADAVCNSTMLNPFASLLPDAEHQGEAAPSDFRAQQYLLFRAVGELLASASSRVPLLVIVDDLHWADESSLQLLRYLAGLASLRNALFLCTFRHVDPTPDNPLLELIEAVSREPTTTWVELAGVGLDEVVELVHRHGSERSPDMLLAETNGNLFFLTELLRQEAEASAPTAVPGTVRQVVTRRVTRLGTPARDVLEFAAVIGRDFDPRLLADVSGLDERVVVDALDAAATSALLVSPAPGRYAFAHALVSTTLYGALSTAARSDAHRNVAEALEHAATLVPAAELARHWRGAGDQARAFLWSRAAGDQAAAVFAPAEAAAWYGRALELAPSDASLRCELAIDLGAAQRQAGLADHEGTLSRAFAEGRRIGRGDLMADAVLASTRLGTSSNIGRVDEERVRRITMALHALGPAASTRQARLLSILGVEVAYHPDNERRNHAARAAIEIARARGDRANLLAVLASAVEALRAPDTLAERLALSAEVVDLAETVGDQTVVFWALRSRLNALDEDGQRDESDELVDRLLELAERLNQPTVHVAAGWAASKRAWLDGDLDEAQRWAIEMGQRATLAGHRDAATNFGSSFLPIQRARGRWGNPKLIDAVDDFAAGGIVAELNARAMQAVMHLAARQHDKAAQLLAAHADNRFAVPYSQVWSTTMALWCHAAADLGDRAAATQLDVLVRPFAGQFATNSSQNDGSFHHHLARLAVILGHQAVAEEEFRLALEAHRRIRAPYHIARTQLAWAQSLLQRTPTQPDTASSLWREAREIALRHRLDDLTRLAEELAPQVGAN